MENLSKHIYNSVVSLLFIITIGIAIAWINNLSLLYELYFYIIWGITLVIGIATYFYGKRNGIGKIAEKFLIITGIFSIVLLVSTFIIYLITSSMP